MKGSDFARQYAKSSQAEWENAAVHIADAGGATPFPMVEVPLAIPDSMKGHTASVFVSSDVFAIGDPDDYLRVPLTPGPAQKILDKMGAFFPTRKLARDIHTASTARIEPVPQWPNKGANLAQYADYNVKVQLRLASAAAKFGQLVSGQGKDIVLSKARKPGRLAIYGWYKLDGSPIQGLNPNDHDDKYVDYSHGTRFVAPEMIFDGSKVRLADMLTSPKYAAIVSDEGALPLSALRYGPGGGTPPAPQPPPESPKVASSSFYALGLDTLISLFRKKT